MLDKYQLTLEENIFLAKRNIVDSIYKESKLEGIAITFPESMKEEQWQVCQLMILSKSTI